MGKIIANPKNYTGNDLENIFFRPLISGPNALDLGIRMMYNMPVPTTLNFWKRGTDLLQKYAAGWNGSAASDKFQKVIELHKVKAEMGYAAEDYFSMVYERIVGRPDVNLGDLTGTELEEAETALFREAIAESVRATMWVGDTDRESGFNTFDGFFKRLIDDTGAGADDVKKVEMTTMDTAGNAEKLFQAMYAAAPAELRAMKGDGHLVLLVTGDVAENYEESLLSGSLDSVRAAKINGIDVVISHKQGDGSSAAFVHFAKLAHLPDYSFFFHAPGGRSNGRVGGATPSAGGRRPCRGRPQSPRGRRAGRG